MFSSIKGSFRIPCSTMSSLSSALFVIVVGFPDPLRSNGLLPFLQPAFPSFFRREQLTFYPTVVVPPLYCLLPFPIPLLTNLWSPLLAGPQLLAFLTVSTCPLVFLPSQLTLQHPAVRSKLGLPSRDAPVGNANVRETNNPGKIPLETPTKWKKVSVEKLSPKELLALSVQLLSKGQKERAIPLLRQALNKDPEYVRALVVMGQTLLQNAQPAEATVYLERAISKLHCVVERKEAPHMALSPDVSSTLIAKEAIEDYRVRNKGMGFGIGFEKAYDNVDWNILVKVLATKGFGYKWCMWMWGCLRNVSFSFLANEAEEDLGHILWHCDFATSVWEFFKTFAYMAVQKNNPTKKMDSLYKKVVQLYKIMSINQQERSVLGHDDEKAQKVDFVTLLEDFLPSTLVFFSDVIPSP
ncbi:ALBINO3-like protein 2 [Cucumis melo var. makuwa]|uniref:ALBINO3-like protein 2 n=1 Tax=Cucumis melo var. makuwa TaxID=1194695 RepID=A0A5A7U6G2_CUCMM|nr:ALBINO3-like protein 2 [Cucumis melo var. makuwa]